jgi:Xaa-Pro aminopeptidase
LRPGISEQQVSARLAYLFHSAGADCMVLPCVIAGTEDPIPVRDSTDRLLQRGDSVMIDLGAAWSGYHADVARTFVLGPPNDKQRHVWDTVQQAHARALALARPGVCCRDMHSAAVQVIEGAGYQLVHRIGHGIGLATSFEWPSLDTEDELLAPGMTICIEPGIYVPGAGNMKLEDDVLITEAGCEVLSHSSADLLVAS